MCRDTMTPVDQAAVESSKICKKKGREKEEKREIAIFIFWGEGDQGFGEEAKVQGTCI